MLERRPDRRSATGLTRPADGGARAANGTVLVEVLAAALREIEAQRAVERAERRTRLRPVGERKGEAA